MTADDQGEVVRLAAQQRAAKPDEPTCVVCGRYGEYICDATDEDVCSLECRDLCTEAHAKAIPKRPPGVSAKRKPSSDSGSGHDDDDEIRDNEAQAERTGEEPDTRAALGDVRKQLAIHVSTIGSSSDMMLLPLWDSFNSLPIELQANIAARGIDHPTPVQMQTIPVALSGAHVLVSAPTGTGKTLAFLVPVVVQIMEVRFDAEKAVPIGLVLAPVRELAIQIEEEAKMLMKGIAKMKTALLVGGLPMPPQLHRLRKGVQLIVATPGRLVDVLVHHSGSGLDQLLNNVRCCVVDEVDMMLSVGFRDAVAQILGELSTSAGRVQFIFTSATVSNQVENVVASCLGAALNYVRIHVGNGVNTQEASSVTINSDVEHSMRWVEENNKKGELFRFLQGRRSLQTLVFVESRAGADMLAEAIEKQVDSMHAKSFHAGKSQEDRLRILEDFVEENIHVLVSTNVLGRGIDMLSVDCVVIFDAPSTSSEYVHLIGRVGRGVGGGGPNTASSMLYVNSRDVSILPELVQMYCRQRLAVPNEVYNAVRSKTVQSASQSRAPRASDDARRAFHILRELDPDELSSRASSWQLWKYSSKRPRYG